MSRTSLSTASLLVLAFCKQNAPLQHLVSQNSIIKRSWPHELGKVEHEPGKGVIIISNITLFSNITLSWPHELGNVENEPGNGVIIISTIKLSRPS